MDDVETPPDPENGNGKGDQARRASLRLRDAETVATTRRDMFGDGSLVDVLAGTREERPGLSDAAPMEPAGSQAPDAPIQETQLQDVQPQQMQPQEDDSHGDSPEDEPTQDGPPREAQLQDASSPPDEAAEDEQQPADAPPADEAAASAAESHGHAQDEPGVPDAAPSAELPPSPDESLDAIIDSFPAEAHALETRSDAQPSGRSLPPLFTAPEHGAGAGGAHAGQTPVSAIFNTLGAVEAQTQGPQPGAAAPVAGPPHPDLPDGDAPAHGQAGGGEDGARDAAVSEDSAHDAPAGSAEPLAQPVPSAQDLAPAPLADAPDGTPPAAPAVQLPFMEPPSPESAAAEGSHRPAGPGVLRFPDPPPAAAGPAAASPPFPEPPGAGPASAEPSVVPPFIELPANDAGTNEPDTTHGDTAPADPGVAPVPGPGPTMAGAASEWPPFPEPPGAEVPPASVGSPPYIELPAAPADGPQGAEPPGAGSARPYPGAPGIPDEPRLPEPREAPAVHHPEAPQAAPEAAADTSSGATAKIAAEATATAEALDNLQRLLDQSMPDTPPAQRPPRRETPPAQQPVRSDMAPARRPARSDTAPARRSVQALSPRSGQRSGAVASPRRWRASELPLRLTDSDPESGMNVYLLGFLTGVALSVMAGLALYFLISAA